MNLINSRKLLKKQNLKELLDICIYNEIEVMENVLKNWLKDENNSLDDYRECITGVGSLVSGVVYLDNKEYRLAGFILKKLRKLKEEYMTEYIYVPIYYEGNCDIEQDPLVFQNCVNLYDDHGFVTDTLGNVIHFDQVLIDISLVNKFVKNKRYDLNAAIKSKGIYLNHNNQ